MNDKFEASNGWTVEQEDDTAVLSSSEGYQPIGFQRSALKALTEYVFHKHGLWLAPNGMLCIRQAEPDLVGVSFEDGEVTYMRQGSSIGAWGTHSDDEVQAAESAADAYFDAHPNKPPQCDAALEVEGVLIRCNKTWEHDLHEGSGKTSQGRSFTTVWETPR